MKFHLLALFAVLSLAASSPRPPPRRWPVTLFKDWERFLNKKNAEPLDVTLDNIWKASMPHVIPTISINDENFKKNTVYQLTCEVMASGPLPATYNVHFYAGDLSLGSYVVKPPTTKTVFTANKNNLATTKHQILEQEDLSNRPVNLLIKPASADSYTCRIEVDDNKHPYNVFSDAVEHKDPNAATTQKPADPPGGEKF